MSHFEDSREKPINQNASLFFRGLSTVGQSASATVQRERPRARSRMRATLTILSCYAANKFLNQWRCRVGIACNAVCCAATSTWTTHTRVSTMRLCPHRIVTIPSKLSLSDFLRVQIFTQYSNNGVIVSVTRYLDQACDEACLQYARQQSLSHARRMYVCS